jgi:hypothetical protein
LLGTHLFFPQASVLQFVFLYPLRAHGLTSVWSHVLDVWFLERPFGETRLIENTVADTAIKYLTSVVAAAAAAATATATATVTKTATTEATSDCLGTFM